MIASNILKLTLHSDVHCLLQYTVTVWACHPAGVLSVMVVSRHWVQYQGQGLVAGVVHSNSVHSNTVSDPLDCCGSQVSRTHNRHSVTKS